MPWDRARDGLVDDGGADRTASVDEQRSAERRDLVVGTQHLYLGERREPDARVARHIGKSLHALEGIRVERGAR